jgi:hypothetical protein
VAVRIVSEDDVDMPEPVRGALTLVLREEAVVAVVMHPDDAAGLVARSGRPPLPIGLRMTPAGAELHRLSEAGVAVEDFDLSLLESAPPIALDGS